MPKKLYVGNLNYATTSSALSELFASVGEVVSLNLVTDRMTGESKGFAFIEMSDLEGAQAAINQLNGREIDGRSIRVAEARPRRDDHRGGNRRGGGRRRRW
jgi:RNA recognition motif-containing protein